MTTHPVSRVACTLVFALTTLSASTALAEETEAPMDADTAQAVATREKAAWGTLVGGVGVGGILASIGIARMDKQRDECEAIPEDYYSERAECSGKVAGRGKTWVYASGISMAAGVVGFLVIRPSAKDREQAAKVLSVVQVSVDPKSRAYSARVQLAF